MFDDTFDISIPSFSGDGRKNKLKISATLLGAAIGAGAGVGIKRLIYGDRGGFKGDVLAGAGGAVAGGITGNLTYRGAKAVKGYMRQRKIDNAIAATDDPDRKQFIRELTSVPPGMEMTGTLADANMRNVTNRAIAKRVAESGVDPSLVPVYKIDKSVTGSRGLELSHNLFGDVDTRESFNGIELPYKTSRDIEGICLTPFANVALHYKGDAKLAKKVYERAMANRRSAEAAGDVSVDSNVADNFIPLHKNDRNTSRSFNFSAVNELGELDSLSNALHRKDGHKTRFSVVYAPRNTVADAEGIFDEETWHNLNPVINSVYHGRTPYNFAGNDRIHPDYLDVYEKNTAEGLVAMAGLKRIMYNTKGPDGKPLYDPARGITTDEALKFLDRNDLDQLADSAGYSPKDIPGLHAKIRRLKYAMDHGGFFSSKMKRNFDKLFSQVMAKRDSQADREQALMQSV